MTTLIVNHHVADFDAWKVVFDEHATARDAHGCESSEVLQSVADANAVTIVMQYPSAAAAQGFLDDQSLKAAMGRGGVDAPPTISILEPVTAGATSS